MGRRKVIDENTSNEAAPEGAASSLSSSSKAAEAIVKVMKSNKNNSLVFTMSEDGTVVTRPKFLSTQHILLDEILGGGIPAGRITEIFSKNEGEGKSSLAAHLMKEMVDQGGLVVLIDSEHGFTEERLRDFGIPLNSVVYVDAPHIEAAFEAIDQTLQEVKDSGVASKCLIVWDSIAGSISKARFEGEFGQGAIGDHARAISAGLPKLAHFLTRVETYLVILNQTRNKIDTFGGGKKESTGGKGLKFYASTRIELSRGAGGYLKQGDSVVGFRVVVKTLKNRIVRPFQVVDMYFHFDRGFDLLKGVFDFLVDRGFIQKLGAWCEMKGVEKKFQQKDFTEVLKSLDVDIVDEIKEQMDKANLKGSAYRNLLP